MEPQTLTPTDTKEGVPHMAKSKAEGGATGAKAPKK